MTHPAQQDEMPSEPECLATWRLARRPPDHPQGSLDNVLTYIDALRAHCERLVEENKAIRRDALFQHESRQLAESRLAALREEVRWIPVSERLPEEDVEILILDKHGRVWLCERQDDEFSDFRSYEPKLITTTERATHWMPLPALKDGK